MTLRITAGVGYGAVGELVSFDLAESGSVRTFTGPSAMTYWPLAEFRARIESSETINAPQA